MSERVDNRDKVRTFRIPESEWQAALEVAKSRDEALSQVMRDALRRYVTRHAPKM
jgi:hypothetical protein